MFVPRGMKAGSPLSAACDAETDVVAAVLGDPSHPHIGAREAGIARPGSSSSTTFSIRWPGKPVIEQPISEVFLATTPLMTTFRRVPGDAVEYSTGNDNFALPFERLCADSMVTMVLSTRI